MEGVEAWRGWKHGGGGSMEGRVEVWIHGGEWKHGGRGGTWMGMEA